MVCRSPLAAQALIRCEQEEPTMRARVVEVSASRAEVEALRFSVSCPLLLQPC